MAATYKICFVGPAGCGKTAMAHKISTGKYNTEYIPTNGAEAYSVSHTYPDGKGVLYIIWDCSGHEKYIRLQRDICTMQM